jgi:hypothetical protein
MLGKKGKKEKIILEFHDNSYLYDKYFYYEGFNITNRKYKENPFCLESEISI